MTRGRGTRDRYDAVVIGAGAAGLAAAQRLAAAQCSVIVVEARDRVGGRIHTVRLPDWSQGIEVGAEFIHGEPETTWQLVREANLTTVPVEEEWWRFAQDRLQSVEFNDLWKRIFERLERSADNDLSFSEFLRRHCADLTPDEIAQAIGYVEGFNAADSRLINTRWLLAADRASGQGGEAAAVRICDGYDRVLNPLLQALGQAQGELRLNTVVETIQWRPGHVEVMTRDRCDDSTASIQADRAVITLPLGVLQAAADSAGSVRFVPDLPEKWTACRSLRMGSVMKLFLRFREAFWRAGGQPSSGFLQVPQGPFPTWWTTNVTDAPILAGWAGGPAAERLAGLGRQTIVDEALRSLSHTFSRDRSVLAALLEDSYLADWQTDPFARGAYSYVAIGGIDSARRLAEPVAATLFFAGEATHEQLSGTVGGALASGYRATDELLLARRS